ncbi:phenylalanine--tRNA ligase subunit alpha [Gehongia tenuis]|uniref:Phenylalanine--tRNA ligase alpha subunit n=1 Tax=Gehongia tenuis TaxID=2763655 RepID=A0A926D332_9FIRM|nr:phenylalanine--tRNA ligase subunit alpha [Gehongia tenuis]MBC8530641.1 phenylalanine--tRNA ligase subunit alpha [Gehongia tenuis]
MKERLEALRQKALEDLKGISDSAALENLRVSIVGKKGELTQFLRGMGSLSPEERPAMGQMINDVRKALETALDEKAKSLKAAELERRLAEEALDVTVPGAKPERGGLHPVTLIQRELVSIFTSMGFSVADGPEVELDHFNFELMNLPKNHPARDMQDTLYVSENVVLRTHTSPVQARVMTTKKPPIYVVCPGRVYRSDEVDASHSPVFHQMECLVVDEGITMGDLKGVLDTFIKKLYGGETKTRLRPSFFPFTEPSAELDISCTLCGGEGCRVCKGTGWLELGGCGMVNPDVLDMCGIDPEKYTGFAFGFGLDRLANMKYGIDDIRLNFEGDLRFLEQFAREG